jgi:hypothetical protein
VKLAALLIIGGLAVALFTASPRFDGWTILAAVLVAAGVIRAEVKR